MYFQQKGATYADYLPNMWYISPVEVFTLEELKEKGLVPEQIQEEMER